MLSNNMTKSNPTSPRGRRSQRVIHFLTQEELKRLLAIMKTKRDPVIFLLADRHGLRTMAIGLLQHTDVDLKQGRITESQRPCRTVGEGMKADTLHSPVYRQAHRCSVESADNACA
jgi:hypothetical protein